MLKNEYAMLIMLAAIFALSIARNGKGERADSYLSAMLPEYKTVLFINKHLAKNAKILRIDMTDRYYLNRQNLGANCIYEGMGYPIFSDADKAGCPFAIFHHIHISTNGPMICYEHVKWLGFTHIIYGPKYAVGDNFADPKQRDRLPSYANIRQNELQALKNYAMPIFIDSKNDFTVYEIVDIRREYSIGSKPGISRYYGGQR